MAVFDAMLVLGEDSTTENTTENIETPQLPLEPRLRTLQRLRELTAYPRRVQIAPLPIQTIGEYQLLRQLALTPMGATYVARRKDAPKLYTLKMLIPYPEWGIKGPQSGVLLSAKLDHPGLAKIVETGSYRDQTYVISEYVHGFSLRRLLDAASRDGSALPLAWIKEMWRQLQGAEVRLSSEISAFDGYAFILEQVALVADALHYAHCNGVVHCDVKPANILLSLCGRTALIDFGIAHAALDERPEKTPKISSDDHGSFFGSFGYAAPEQFLGQQKDLQAHTDTWGLGATLFEMITGQTPFGRLDF
ncbi:serine/threonine protein kinase, partial [Myxococcota bacterium]|nr:serine/threonine protein kinase [Myxococcota bacterium]